MHCGANDDLYLHVRLIPLMISKRAEALDAHSWSALMRVAAPGYRHHEMQLHGIG